MLSVPASVATRGVPSWCPDDDTRDNVVARRNVLAALWAGRNMGLTGPALTSYAVEVHMSDFAMSGDTDIVAKLVGDLHGAGLSIRPSEVRAKLSAFHQEALRQTAATD
jgi:hypothetical protein